MLPEELKQVLGLSGGKMIVSEGNVDESYVVMKLGEYLKEKGNQEKVQNEQSQPKKKNDQIIVEESVDLEVERLTNEELLDRINADIALLKQRNSDRELDELLLDENDELDYEKIEFGN